MAFIIVDRDPNRAVFAQKFLEEPQARIHHAQPLIVARQVFRLLADSRAKPGPDFRRVDIVVIDPGLIARVVGRVNIDALHLACIIGQQRLQGFEIVALNQQVARVRIANALALVAMDQPIGHLAMMVHHRLFADPIECGHKNSVRMASGRGFGPARFMK